MRPYEVMVIFDSAVEDTAVRKQTDGITKELTEAGGQVHNVEHWGRRRFAYEINKKTEGSYVLILVRAPSEAIIKLERSLMLSDDVVRHKMIRMPEHVFGKTQTVRVSAGSSRGDGSPDSGSADRGSRPRGARRS